MTCERCGACCKIVMFDYVECLEEQTIYRGGKVFDWNGKKYFVFKIVCDKLTKENLCSIHENKPAFCKAQESGSDMCLFAREAIKLFNVAGE